MTPNRITASALSILLIAGTGSLFAASAPVIGMASASSGITLDNSKVSGNATLFEGSTLQAENYSRIHLNNGTRLDIGAGSKVQVFANRASLVSGVSEIQSGSGFEIDAQTLKIRPSEASSIARVKLDGDKRVMVTALNSPVNVMNRDGLLVAKVNPGMPMSFMPQNQDPNSDDNKKKAAAAAAAGGAGAGAAAGGVAGAAAAIGVSTAALVVGGVAIAAAATIGGLAASGVIGSSNTSP